MLNMKFAEAMELTEDELMEVSGGEVIKYGFGGGYAIMGYGIAAPSWQGNVSNPSGYFNFKAPGPEGRRRYG